MIYLDNAATTIKKPDAVYDACLLYTSGEMMIATRHGNTTVKKGDKLAGTRIIPVSYTHLLHRCGRA